MGEPVGEFQFIRISNVPSLEWASTLTSSNDILRKSNKPSVIHFYNGGWGGCRPCAAQMEYWAKSFGNSVQFLCICVESKQVAQSFASMFQFKHVINGLIPSNQYMPNGYGQLGCSGFIVVDTEGNFLSKRTTAFLDVGDDAFRDVESLLHSYVTNKKKGSSSIKRREPVGVFRFLRVSNSLEVSKTLTSSKDILNQGKPSVIHLYNGGWGGCRPCAAQMEAWASSSKYRDKVQFLCICVESIQVAQNFGNMFRFTHVINGFIPSDQHMPRGYGQLGCSGFILVDGEGNFLSKRTTAFLDVGDEAFRDLEDLLSSYMEEMEPSSASEDVKLLHPNYPYSKGNIVVLDGIKSQSHLNGKKVQILGFETRTGRFSVQFVDDKSRRIAVLPCSLAPDTDSVSKTGENITDDKIETAPRKRKSKEEEEKKADETSITSIEAPASVGVDCMDDEHKSCSDAINQLLEGLPKASPELLRRVVMELEEHFKHEEVLMKKHWKQSQNASSFSAFSSHVNDHQRILNIGQNELNRVEEEFKSSETIVTWSTGSNSCKSTKKEVFIEPRVAQNIARAFLVHADRFDALYAESIPSTVS